MDELINVLPTEIKTSVGIAIVVALWRLYIYIKKILQKQRDEKKAIEDGIIDKERRRAKINSRIENVEKKIEGLEESFERKNQENREDFHTLSKKIDKVLEILIKPSSN